MVAADVGIVRQADIAVGSAADADQIAVRNGEPHFVVMNQRLHLEVSSDMQRATQTNVE